MKSKKLLVSLAIVAAVVVIIVVMASTFSVRHVVIRYHKFDGKLTTVQEDSISEEVIEKIAKGKSTIFLSKTNFLAQVNVELKNNYPQWHAFAVVKSFPNILEVHFVKRTAIAKLTTSEGVVYLDSFGYSVTEVPEYNCIDITSAFDATNPTEPDADGKFKFQSPEENKHLQYVLEAILATWQCFVEVEDMDDVLLPAGAFEFQSDGSMLIHPRLGGTIRLLAPETDLSARLQKAYAVYYNPSANLQQDDCVITVNKNGRISTLDPNKK